MKKLFWILAAIALWTAAAALPAAAQAPEGASTPWTLFEKELGLQTTYSVEMIISAMGMDMNTRIVRNGGTMRTEMTMPFMNVKMVMLEIPQDGTTTTYTLFPEKRKYVIEEEEEEQDSEAVVAPRIEELGTEEFEGVSCVKRRITVMEDGVATHIDALFSPAQKDMPVKMTVKASVPMGSGGEEMPMESTILFKNYDFSTPAASLFEVPAGYTRVGDMMEAMMDGGAEGFGALLQQMQLQMED